MTGVDHTVGADPRRDYGLLLAVARGQDVIDWNGLAIVFVAVAGAMAAVSALLAWRAA